MNATSLSIDWICHGQVMLGGHDPEVGAAQMLEIDDDLSSLIASDSDEDASALSSYAPRSIPVFRIRCRFSAVYVSVHGSAE